MTPDLTRRVVTAVVVTYNRCTSVLRSLDAILEQDRPPDRVLVVDNASTDGTPTLLRERYGDRIDLRVMERNTGGAGGFSFGLQRALAGGADVVWLMDDDAVARTDALSALLAAYEDYPGTVRPALVASRVVWVDGSTHRMNMPRRLRHANAIAVIAAARVGCTPIRTSSFVSVLIDADAARVEDPIIADYFLWNDDVEYTARLLRGRVGLSAPASVVTHHTATNYNTLAESGGRLFLDVRNMLWFVGRCPALTIGERTFFAAITVRRWFRTIEQSRHRRATIATIGRAIGAALRSGPRPTADVLGGLGATTSRVDLL